MLGFLERGGDLVLRRAFAALLGDSGLCGFWFCKALVSCAMYDVESAMTAL